MNTSPRIALLVDGDNADHRLLKHYVEEASKFGRATVKRIYGDWTMPNMNVWKKQLNILAFRPIQKFSYTKGKNSTDTALIIDAIDLLHSGSIDGICIASSDSDYTGLAHRYREEGLLTIGIGKSTTPDAFIGACDNFIFEEILNPKPEIKQAAIATVPSQLKTETGQIKTRTRKSPLTKEAVKTTIPNLINKVTNRAIDSEMIDQAYTSAMNIDEGLANASRFSEAIKKLDPTFDIRNYGFKTFKEFVKALSPHFEIVMDEKNIMYVKRRE